MDRRTWLGAAVFAAQRLATGQQTRPPDGPSQNTPLPVEQYEPKSMLHVPETQVPKARFPVIDFHTHITFGSANGAARFSMDPANCLAVMDRRNIRMMVDVTGGYGDGLKEAIAKLQTAHPGRFAVFTEPSYANASDP